MSTATKETVTTTEEKPIQSLSSFIEDLDAKGQINWETKAQQQSKPVVEEKKTEVSTTAETKTTTENKENQPLTEETPVADLVSKLFETKKEEKKVETKVEEKLKPEEDPDDKTIHPELPKTVTPEANRAFKLKDQSLKAEKAARAEADNKIKELTEQLEKAKTASPEQAPDVAQIKAELEATKTQLAEYENELKMTRVEATREFKQLVTEPLNKLTKDAKSFAEKSGIDYKDLQSALSISDPVDRAEALDKLSSELTTAKQSLLLKIADQISEKTALKDEMLAKASETLKAFEANRANTETKVNELTAQQQAQLKEQNKRVYQTEAQKVWDSLSSDNPFFKNLDGEKYAKYNAELADIKNQVMTLDFDSLPPHVKAGTAFLAARVPQIMAQNAGLLKEIQNLTNRLAGISKSTPSTAAGASGTVQAEAKPATLAEHLNTLLGAGK